MTEMVLRRQPRSASPVDSTVMLDEERTRLLDTIEQELGLVRDALEHLDDEGWVEANLATILTNS